MVNFTLPKRVHQFVFKIRFQETRFWNQNLLYDEVTNSFFRIPKEELHTFLPLVPMTRSFEPDRSWVEAQLSARGWTLLSSPILELNPVRDEVAQPLDYPRRSTVVDFFDLLWDESIMAHLESLIVSSAVALPPYLSPRQLLWKFFGQCLLLGIFHVCDTRDLWNTGPRRPTYPFREYFLGENVWFSLSAVLEHWDITYLHDALNSNFHKHLFPGGSLAVDEIRVRCWHMDCPFKVWDTRKPDKFAIQSRSLHDSSGYLLHFTDPSAIPVTTAFEALREFANYLTQFDPPRHITADRLFGSVDQAEAIHLPVWFTICCKRNAPTFLWKDGLQRLVKKRDTEVALKDGFIAACTYSRRKVNILTNSFVVEENPEASTPHGRSSILRHYRAGQQNIMLTTSPNSPRLMDVSTDSSLGRSISSSDG